MRRVLMFLSVFAAFGLPHATAQDDPKLAGRVRTILEQHCYRCHGQNGANEGGFGDVLDFPLLREKKVKPGDPAKSRLFRRMGVNKDMPPEDEKARPTDAEIALVKQWIEAGAPVPTADAATPRTFVSLKDELEATRVRLRKARPEDRPYLRFFTLRHLHNLPADQVRDQDLRANRAALSKLLNSLSWKNALVLPEAIDPAKTVFVVDIRKLDWDRKQLWLEILRDYPYGLKHDRYPDDAAVNDLASEVYELADTEVPAVRADWFIATASRPPLYHKLLQLPQHAGDLERSLKVDVADNFRRGQLWRAGFNASGVSGSNRLIERHDAAYGAYWKSYDFKTSTGRGNLFVYPLGPEFRGNEFSRQAFRHDGGEVIFNLPNGLQGYLLVDGKDQRIDAGPIEVVSDGKKTSGTPLVVNGLSCMACHRQGMIRFRDQVRPGNILGGNARDKVRQLYPAPEELDRLVAGDEERFLQSLGQVLKPFLEAGEDARDYPEPISAIARWYLAQELTATEASRELGLADAKMLEAALGANPRLQELGLFPLSKGNTVKREVWEFLGFVTSPFQEAARELKLGTPVRHQ